MDVVTYALCKKNSLPPVTENDIGKILAVDLVSKKGAAVIPEQTLSTGLVQDANGDKFVVGGTYVATIDGTEYIGEAVAGTGSGTGYTLFQYPSSSNPTVNIIKSNLGQVRYLAPAGTHVVSFYELEQSVKWTAQTIPNASGVNF